MRKTQPTVGTGERRRRTVAEREEVVARYMESGLTQRVFAKEKGIGVSTLARWLREVSTRDDDDPAGLAYGRGAKSDQAQPLTLLEVELAEESKESGQSSARYAVELPGGTRLHVGADFADSAVRRLLGLLQEVDR